MSNVLSFFILIKSLLCPAALPTTFVFMQAAVFGATTSPCGQTKLQKLNYKPTPKPAACINILLQARARQPQTYFCNQTVHRYWLSFTVRFAFIISYHNSSTCLIAVTRSPVSPVTLIRHCQMCQKSPPCRMLFLCPVYLQHLLLRHVQVVVRCHPKPKKSNHRKHSKQSPRPVRGAAKLSACCELSTETNLKKKSTVTHVNFTLRFVNGNLSRSAWPATLVHIQFGG